MNSAISLFVLLALLVGGIFLQIFLSKKNNKWLGLILPTITFLNSVLSVLELTWHDGMSSGEIFTHIATTFLVGNIPTIVLLGVYFAYREKMKTRAQLEKMSIQDLE